MRFLLSFAFLLFAVAAHAAPNPWEGEWDTRWRDGGARMTLHQSGERISGTYSIYDGAVEGTVSGAVLNGRWREGPRSGGFQFVLSPDANSFVGRFDSGEWWTGQRLAGPTSAYVEVDLSSPRAAMRSFLQGGEGARYVAPNEILKSLSAIDFGDAKLLPGAKVALATRLFDIVDAATFRVYSLPDNAEGDTFSVTLKQAGTGAEAPIQFRKSNDLWRIVMPDEATLAALGKAMFTRSNGRPPSSDDFRNRRSPSDAYRAFTRGFYDWNNGGRALTLSALDLSAVPQAIRDYQGDLAARYIAGILNRIGLPEAQEVPDDPNSLEPYVLLSHPAGRLVIAPVPGEKPTVWAFTPDSVRNARALFNAVEDLPAAAGPQLPSPPSTFFDLRKRVREVSRALVTDFGPIELWQIIGWAGVLAISLTIGRALTEVAIRVGTGVFASRDAIADQRTFRYAVWGAIGFSIYKLIIPAIGLSDEIKQFSVATTGALLIASVMWLVWISVDAFGGRFFGTGRSGVASMDNIVVSLVFGLLKLAVLVAGLTLMAMEFSLPYEGIIASLSIGGLAVAFASRETLSNVFGAGVLAIDRPFKRGDQISAGGVEGVVEHVGIRSTRVRTAGDNVIIVPNGKLSDSFVTNQGNRALAGRRFHINTMKLPLPYTTTVAQLDALLQGVRDIAAGETELLPDKTQVLLTPMGLQGVQLAISYGVFNTDTAVENAVVNKFVLDVLKLCDRLQVKLSDRPAAAVDLQPSPAA